MKRTNKIFSKATALLFMLLLSCLVIGQIAFAEGDGTGGGSSEPLSLVSSSLSNGATGVSLKPSITLTFSKNIVNMSVSANNKNCFSLLYANGANVPIDIIFADDQIDREKRNDALIIPKANLAPGTNYTLVVSSALRSKSGVTMGSDIRISFTTEGSQPQPNQSSSVTAPKPETSVPPTPSQPSTQSKTETSSTNAASTNSTTTNNGKNTPAQDAQTAANSPSEEQASDVTKEDANKANQENIKKPKPYQAVDSINTESKSDKQESNSSSTWVVATIIIALGATAALVYFYKRKKRTAK
ncbi:hypothetical protein HHO41_00125 [Bacillus sp. DNRA2]|uniref:Ig-like domain-containing protein n=1 Tax=Bacillus sp. DNRA2 TaxID=2723053 RepID=UPI00145FC850|nr:Ig-like domain-containing protein [Bacillus sp. DNRA2]NMD68674.1 hypothetical protein [Bacillus sp. DNRA2]